MMVIPVIFLGLFMVHGYSQTSRQSLGHLHGHSSGQLNGQDVTVDLLAENNPGVNSVDCEVNDLPSRLFWPENGKDLMKVVAGDTHLFNATKGKSLRFIILNLSEGKPKAASGIHKGTGPIPTAQYFVDDNGTWKKVAKKEDFEVHLRNIWNSQVKPTNNEFFELDLSTLGESNDNYVVAKLEHMHTTVVTPHTGHVANKVVDGQSIIWDGSGAGKRCVTLWIAEKGDKKLLLLTTGTPEVPTDLKYFSFKDGKWESKNQLTFGNEVKKIIY